MDIQQTADSQPEGERVVEEEISREEWLSQYGQEETELDSPLFIDVDEYVVSLIQSRIHAPDYHANTLNFMMAYNKFVKDGSSAINANAARIHELKNADIEIRKDIVYQGARTDASERKIADNTGRLDAQRDIINNLRTSISNEALWARQYSDSINNNLKSAMARQDAQAVVINQLKANIANEALWARQYSDSINSRVTAQADVINGLKTTISNEAKWAREYSDSINNTVKAHGTLITGMQGDIKNEAKWAKEYSDSINGRVKAHGDLITSMQGDIKNEAKWAKEYSDSINGRVKAHGDLITGMQGDIKNEAKWAKEYSDSINGRVKAHGDLITSMQGDIKNEAKWAREYSDSINNNVKSNDAAINKRVDDIDIKLKSIGDWMDTGIFLLMNENLSDIKKVLQDIRNFTTYWRYTAFPDFGKMIVENFKSFNELLTAVNTNIKNSDTSNQKMMDMLFGETTDGTDGGSFSKMVYKRIYSLHYSMIEHFDEMQDDYLQVMKMDLATVASGVNTSNGFLNTIVSLLNSILTKPPTNINVVVPPAIPLDYDKLGEVIRDAIGEAFNVTNEAGTNFWDVLKEAIKSGFELLGNSLSSMVEALGKILDFIDGLLDKIISLIVPDNTDFIDKGFDDLSGKFNKKFEVVFKLSGDIKTLFTPIETNAFDSMSFEYMGAKADMNQAKRSLDPYASKFRVLMQILIWILCVIGCYRKITGKGDLINDS